MKFLLSPYGRTSRAAYWGFMIGIIVVTALSMGADRLAGTYNAETDSGPFETIVGLLLIWPGIAVSVKRFHDRNMTGWWYLILTVLMIVAGLIGAGVGMSMSDVGLEAIESMTEEQMVTTFWPAAIGVGLVAVYWFIVQLVLPGTKGDNKYGPDPLAK